MTWVLSWGKKMTWKIHIRIFCNIFTAHYGRWKRGDRLGKLSQLWRNLRWACWPSRVNQNHHRSIPTCVRWNVISINVCSIASLCRQCIGGALSNQHRKSKMKELENRKEKRCQVLEEMSRWSCVFCRLKWAQSLLLLLPGPRHFRNMICLIVLVAC